MTKRMNAVLALLLVASIVFSACGAPKTEEQTEESAVSSAAEEPAVEGSAFKPGTYRAEAQGHNAPIVVEVTVSENKIDDITVVEHQESRAIGDVAMEKMAAEMIDRQSLNVDTIAGATVTGAIFKSIVTDAVAQSGADTATMQEPGPEMDKNPLPDTTADIVVVGSGSAGMAATLHAAESGLDVILVEQLGLIGGSSARAGGLIGAGTVLLNESDVEFSYDDFYGYLTAPLGENLSEETLDKEFCERLKINSGKNIDWLYEMGVEVVAPYPGGYHPGKDGQRLGGSLTEVMQAKYDKMGVDYRLNTKATEILMDENGAVSGLVVTAPNGTDYTISTKNVILATGGFFGSDEATKKYIPELAGNGTDESIGADGSGIELAEKVGGVPTLMEKGVCNAVSVFYNGVSRDLEGVVGGGGIAVNSKGERYVNEDSNFADFTAPTLKQDAVFVVMDQTVMDSLKDNPILSTEEIYVKADTIEELAKELGIDEAGLKATVEKYAEFVEAGEDTDFGKESLYSNLTSAPFYGVKTKLENHTCYGGIKVNNDAQVLKEDGSVIPGLFAAGEVALFKTAGRAPFPECIEMGKTAVIVAIESFGTIQEEPAEEEAEAVEGESSAEEAASSEKAE